MKDRAIVLVLGGLSCALVATVASPCAATLRKTYDAGLNTLPDEQGFTLYVLTPPSPPCTIQDGAMYQALTSIEGAQTWTSSEIPLDFGVGALMEADLKILQSSYGVDPWGYRGSGYLMLMADAPGRCFVVWIAADKIYLTHDGSGSGTANKPFDPTDGFHHYRFTVSGGVGSLFIDGSPDPFLSLAVGPTWYPFPNTVAFGDGTRIAQSESLLRSFSYVNIPEPATLSLLALGGLTLLRRRKR